MKNIAIILASGNGSRFGSKLPKQFIKLAGKPVISYTLNAFNTCNLIDEIIIVTNPDYLDLTEEIVISENFNKVKKIIKGGKQRYESTWAAINAINDENCNLLLHDAVRPFVSHRIITDCINELEIYNAIDVIADPTDTIVKIKNNNIMSIPNREFLGRGQTPQAFKKIFLKEAYTLFMQTENKFASDDCGIFLKYMPQMKIGIVKGEEKNFKITHPQDIYLADNIIRDGLANEYISYTSKFDNIINDKVIVIFGGTSGIGASLTNLSRELGANIYPLGRTTGCDITNPKSISKTLKEIFEIEGRIDFIINTAGILVKKPLSFTTYEDIKQIIDINYLGALYIAKESFEYLKLSSGMLVNFTSSSYTRGRSSYSIYSSSKAAIVNITQALAEEWSTFNIRVNCINPERTDTPMRRNNFGIEPKNSLLTPKEVAVKTLSTMCTNISGQIITVKKEHE